MIARVSGDALTVLDIWLDHRRSYPPLRGRLRSFSCACFVLAKVKSMDVRVAARGLRRDVENGEWLKRWRSFGRSAFSATSSSISNVTVTACWNTISLGSLKSRAISTRFATRSPTRTSTSYAALRPEAHPGIQHLPLGRRCYHRGTEATMTEDCDTKAIKSKNSNARTTVASGPFEMPSPCGTDSPSQASDFPQILCTFETTATPWAYPRPRSRRILAQRRSPFSHLRWLGMASWTLAGVHQSRGEIRELR